ncbi:PRC-barrel domain-containing protein [Sporichthya sp.]|uniref:PRC-barrel domain containing protein n=1 Tax=Sporichthya sp. TaxID=65475 RepID=UPI00179AE129|nr:PRC-barrel domain-containing protein [Sporichthya sp.]MBA3744211.1 PRC-barrel domain-containing protein [Sporichthya sp.]
MRITDARHRPVVATGSAETVGRVDGFLIEAEAARITGLRIEVDGSSTVLPWDKVGAFGPDAITVTDASVLREPADLAEQRRIDPELDPIGKPAIEETGNNLGTVSDVDFDPATGALRAVITDVYELPADRLLGLGTYAMVFGDMRGLTPA